MRDRHANPFEPPADPLAPTVELTVDAAQAMSAARHEVPLPAPKRREPLRYQRPNRLLNLGLFAFAGVGLVAVVLYGARLLRDRVEGTSAAAAAPAAAAPPQPVAWRPVEKGDAVLVTIEVSPKSARLLLDGEPLPSNPVRLPRDGARHTLSASAPGYAPAAQELSAEGPKTVRIKLRKAR
jgi:hypothetical protein